MTVFTDSQITSSPPKISTVGWKDSSAKWYITDGRERERYITDHEGPSGVGCSPYLQSPWYNYFILTGWYSVSRHTPCCNGMGPPGLHIYIWLSWKEKQKLLQESSWK